MIARNFLLLCIITFVAARGGIGGRIAVYTPTSHEYQLRKLIKNDWNCDPFTNCKPTDYDCMLEKCAYNKTSGTDCSNKIVGQYSSMCLQLGVNDLKKKIFLGKSFSLVLEPNIVARCLKYDLFSHFVSECELFRVNQADEHKSEIVKMKDYRNFYYRTTKTNLEIEKKQFELMLKQMEYNNQSIVVLENDYRKIDFEILIPAVSHQFKVSTTTGISFTLPEGTTEKCAFPVYAGLNMGIKLVDESCYWAYEYETKVVIKKTLSCSIREFFSF
ncbi:MAG: hypothetical protein FJX80_09835 [Bacteroidetes bacterium]|nr:hypothetical protein [Bacteroidota bacterium]